MNFVFNLNRVYTTLLEAFFIILMAKAKVVPKSTPVPFFPLLLHLSQTGNNLLSVIVLRQNLHLRF